MNGIRSLFSFRRMYWADVCNARIEGASMDGSSRTVIHNSSLIFPIAMALDYETQTLYWADWILRQLESSSVDGSNRMLLASLPLSTFPWAMTFFQGVLYWTDWNELAVISASLNSPSNMVVLVRTGGQPTGIQVISEDRQMEG